MSTKQRVILTGGLGFIGSHTAVELSKKGFETIIIDNLDNSDAKVLDAVRELCDQEVYFARPTLRLIINQPFAITEREGQYDIVATVRGGGLSGQAGAVKHGISQALTKYEPALRATVKAAGFLTRDSRVVERKKYGRAKARRSFQFSKR